jgi:hypothetical protein
MKTTVTCQTCRQPITLTALQIQDGYGTGDAACPTCNGRWRYVHTPATGWNRAIDLNKYEANQEDIDGN